MNLSKLRVFNVFRRGLDSIMLSPVKGTTIAGEREIKAIVKFKGGLKRASQLRRTSSDLTVHIRPEDVDDYANPQDIIGAAIRWRGRYYSVDGVSVGRNYETGEDEHITLNCSLAIYTDTRPKFCREKDRAIILTTETGRPFMVEKWQSDEEEVDGSDGGGGEPGAVVAMSGAGSHKWASELARRAELARVVALTGLLALAGMSEAVAGLLALAGMPALAGLSEAVARAGQEMEVIC